MSQYEYNSVSVQEIEKRKTKLNENIMEYYIIQTKDNNYVSFNDCILAFSKVDFVEKFIILSRSYLTSVRGFSFDKINMDIQIVKIIDIKDKEFIENILIADGFYIDINLVCDLFKEFNNGKIVFKKYLAYIKDKIIYENFNNKAVNIGLNMIVFNKNESEEYKKLKSFLLNNYAKYVSFIDFSEFEYNIFDLEFLNNIINIIDMRNISHEQIQLFLNNNDGNLGKIYRKIHDESKICIFIIQNDIIEENNPFEHLVFKTKIKPSITYSFSSIIIFNKNKYFVQKSRNINMSYIEIDQLI